MKVSNKRYNPKLVLTALALCATTLIVGCSKKDDTKDLIGDGTKIIVNVMGITDIKEVSAGKVKANAGEIPAIKDGEIMPKEMINFEAFDAQVSLTKDELKKRPVSIGETVTSTLGSGQLMAAAMEPGVTYRLVIYDASDNTLVSSTELVSGTPGEVNIRKGGTYDWYAVSYNNTDNIPDINSSSVMNVPEGSDLLYAAGDVIVDINAPDGNVPLGIVFTHKFSRIGLELNTMGMFANMNSVGVVVNGATGTTGTFDLVNNAFTSSSSDPITVDYSNFENVDPLYGDQKIAYIYSSVETATNLSVSINALDIQLDDGTNRVFSNLVASPVTFDFTLTPQQGASYTARMNFVESPLTIAGVRWARQNVYHQGGHNPYRFHHTYAHTNARNSYFSFRGSDPLEYGTEEGGDPCALVYPAGVWRSANRDDFLRLTGNLILPSYPRQTVTYGTEGGLGYYEYQAAEGVDAPYPSNNLRFNMNGGSIGIALVEDLIELDLGTTYGNTIEIWSRTPLLDLVILSAGAYHYYGSRSGSNNNASVPTDILNINLLGGLNVVESSFKNVRCVRN